jgi:glycosyltransferase involved in cell wall biosynthesis
MSVSVLILTLDEEINLPACLESLRWSDDVVVYDSFSSDRTVEIAQQFGARVVQRKFDNWSAHQNWAVENIDFKHPWVYYSDADERVPADLAKEIQEVVADSSRQEVAYRLRFKNMFMGKWNKHSSLYPTWVLRLFRPDKVRWERLCNPVPVVDGPEGRLKAHFEHYSFNKGMSDWFRKHNQYSQQEAQELIKTVEKGVEWKRLFSLDAAQRRIGLKQLAFHLPFRPFAVFCYLYFVRLGFLDGKAGLTYCRLRAIYEYMIDLKVIELRRREKGLSI